jgi:hypothetical protein
MLDDPTGQGYAEYVRRDAFAYTCNVELESYKTIYAQLYDAAE